MRTVGPAELSKRLLRMSNTAPGPDKVRYNDLKRIDPGCLTLAVIYTRCIKMRKVPKGWKESETILLHKGGPLEDVSNWRPLAMGNCVAKLYAAVLADRITVWARREHQLSPEQKGFLTDEGCLEENFLLQSAIDDCRRSNKQLCVGWLDLTNAFGSVPHRHIFNTLERMGLPTGIINVIKDLYEEAGTRVRTINGHTDRIHLCNGVKQGCPLSPIIFNLAMEPLLRTIRAKRDKTCYKLVGGMKPQMMVYADDICVTANTPEALQETLSIAGKAAKECGLTFKPSKCATLHMNCQKGRRVQPSVFSIQGGSPKVLKEGEAYRHLGIPTGYRVAQTPTEAINQMTEDLNAIDESALAPWQKIDAVSTFINPRIEFIVRGGMSLRHFSTR